MKVFYDYRTTGSYAPFIHFPKCKDNDSILNK